jgi:hypothetical protein
MQFTKAVRKKAKLRLALTGPSGSGKTYGALLLAKGIGGKVAVIDSEHGSASLYANLLDYDTLELVPPYSPERYIAAIHAAEKAGYDVIVIDSTTHEWSGSGGCLEINETTAKAKFNGNTWSAWNETTPRHRAFIDAMLQSPAHIIATGRSKTETAQQDGTNGRKKVVKLGMKTEQREGFEYEFGLVLDIVHDGHYAVASKDRTGMFVDKDPQAITAEPPAAPPAPALMDPSRIADWLAAIEAAGEDEVEGIVAEALELAKEAKDRDAYQAFRTAARKRAA